MSTPTERYDNLKPGDKVTIELTVGSVNPQRASFNNNIGFQLDTLKKLGAVVTRAPRVVKPGDPFVWEKHPYVPVSNQIIKTLVWMDEKTIVYEATNHQGVAVRYTLKTGEFGKLIYHEF